MLVKFADINRTSKAITIRNLPTDKVSDGMELSMNKRKVKMTIRLDSMMEYPIVESDVRRLRRIEVEDVENIAHTMVDAYTETIDYEGESAEDAAGEVQNVLQDGYGRYMQEASFLIEGDASVASAIMINLFQGSPMVTYVFTAKKYSRQGHAKSLLLKSIAVLKDNGYKELSLYVTEGNDSAIKLYTKLGFRVVDEVQ